MSRTRRKDLRSLISSRLEDALKDLKPFLSEKKFRKRLKRASRLLTADLKVAKDSSNDEAAPGSTLRKADDGL